MLQFFFLILFFNFCLEVILKNTFLYIFFSSKMLKLRLKVKVSENRTLILQKKKIHRFAKKTNMIDDVM